MFAKQRKLFSLHVVFMIMLIGGLPGILPAKASPAFLLTRTATPMQSYKPLYVSLTESQFMGGISSSDEDILRFDGKTWSLFFDGSDVNVGASDLVAFSIVDANTILMAFNTIVTVNGIVATPQDVVQFEATSLGNVTAGTFSLYFDGSDVGLADGINEKIDSLNLRPNGRLLISTNGDPIVPGVRGGRDEDVLAFTPTSLGRATSGTWSLYFDGSDVGLAETGAEDIDAFDIRGGKIFLSTGGDFSVNGISGADEDVFVCVPTSLGANTACNYSPVLFFDGSTWGLSANDVDAFNFLALGFPATSTPTPDPTATRCPIPTPEILEVEPVISPTDQTSQVVTVYMGNGDWAKVSSESGVYTADFSGRTARVTVPLLTNTTHHLTVTAHVREVTNPDGCVYGNYTLSTTVDKFGRPLTIVQTTGAGTPTATQTATQTPTITPTFTITPTATFCPQPTPEPLWVEPVISPTNHTSQVITVRIGNGDSVTVSSEADTRTVTGNFSVFNPAVLSVDLLKNTTHHLSVSAHVRSVPGPGGCTYGNYTLQTTVDRYGAPLTIVQQWGTLTPSATPGDHTLTLSPVADSYVNAENPTANYGAVTMLRTDASPNVHSYLRFQVQGLTGPVVRATLRLSAQTTSGVGYQVRRVSDNTWSENMLNYNNAPALGDVIGSSGPITAGWWSSVDVTSYIIGNGVFSLALTSTSSTSFTFASREAPYSRPELILETQSGDVFLATFTPSPPNPPMRANAPTATQTASPTPGP